MLLTIHTSTRGFAFFRPGYLDIAIPQSNVRHCSHLTEDIQVGITPTLRKVVLGHLGNVYGEDTRPGKEFSQRLAKWINQMRAGGAPIFNITMSISPKSPALAELRSLVPDVEVLISKNLWDEHGESYCY